VTTEPGALTFRDVRAGWGRREVLHGIDLDMAHGSFTAVVGCGTGVHCGE